MNGLGGARTSIKQVSQSMDLKQIGSNSTGVFDVSQYAFFGNDVVEEVELGGLEDVEEELPVVEDSAFEKEDAEVDDLASIFSKLIRDPEGYRSTVPIACNGLSQRLFGNACGDSTFEFPPH